MIQVLSALVIMVSAIVSAATPIWARTAAPATRHSLVGCVFRLSVDGPVAPTDTFWVAYGPLAGTWGLIRLGETGPRLYEARATLPRGRTVFAFIEGRGVMHTRLGSAPGKPVSTIRQIGPTSASAVSLAAVLWHEPIG